MKRKLKYRDIVMIEPTGEIGYVLLTDGVSAACVATDIKRYFGKGVDRFPIYAFDFYLIDQLHYIGKL